MTSLTYKHGSTTIGNLKYTYDADRRRNTVGGSLAMVAIPWPTGPNSFNADNEMTGFDGSTLGYDTDGQMTSDPVDTYSWDTRRHLSAISGVDGQNACG